MEASYELWRELMLAGEDIGFFKEFFVRFYQAFIYNDRWLQYLEVPEPRYLLRPWRFAWA